jgi:hypothetical protein
MGLSDTPAPSGEDNIRTSVMSAAMIGDVKWLALPVRGMPIHRTGRLGLQLAGFLPSTMVDHR